MGLYQRSNGVFYLQKRINGRLFRRSLETRNRSEAEMLYDQWRREYLLSKISGQQKIPLPLNMQVKPQKQRKEEFHRPNLFKAYAEYLKTCENEDNTHGTLSSKKKVLQILQSKQFSWEDINPEEMADFQNWLKKEYSHSTAGKHDCVAVKKSIDKSALEGWDSNALETIGVRREEKDTLYITVNAAGV